MSEAVSDREARSIARNVEQTLRRHGIPRRDPSYSNQAHEIVQHMGLKAHEKEIAERTVAKWLR